MKQFSNLIKNKKNLMTITSIVLFLIITFSSIFYYTSLATLDLLVAPTSATITINGKKYHNGQHKLSAGTYDVKISKKDFNTKTFTLNLKSNQTTNLHTYLDQTDGKDTWYLNHNDDDLIRTQIGDEEATKQAEDYEKKYPIIKLLPFNYANYDENYNYTEFIIDGGKFDGCKEEFCLKITDSTGGNEEAAKSFIQGNGFDPDDYEIIYEYTPIEPLE